MNGRTSPPGAPIDLRAERVTDPIGLDEAHPLLSWRLRAGDAGRLQTAYRIMVAAGGDPLGAEADVVWDSGVTVSGEAVDVAYAGTPLQPRTRYGWRVRIVDESGRDSGWSEVAWWETGLLSAQQWLAEWVTAPAELVSDTKPSLDMVPDNTLRNVNRIWRVDGGSSARFRKVFTVEGDRIASASLAVAGAENLLVYLNGVAVDPLGDVAKAVVPGRNVLAIEAASASTVGLVAHLRVEAAGGTPISVFTDDRWVTSPVESTGEDWAGQDFDDSRWRRALSLGRHGDPPWGREPVTYRPSPYLRREFTVDRPVARARLYATALGLYELHLAGQRVGTERFAPGWTDYRERIAYQTYDVTDLVLQGGNVLAARLADGWYAGRVAWFDRFRYGQARALRAQLVIDHPDGTATVVATDRTWRAGTGGIRFADLQDGEVVDARAEPDGWTLPGFDDTAWDLAAIAPAPEAPVVAQTGPPIRVLHELPAQAITELRPGVRLIDFGQNIAGWVRVRLQGMAGQRVIVRHGEVLQHTGELYAENLRTARATDEYILRGDPDGETFEPRFTVHGFRYCEITGYSGPLALGDITALVVHTDMAPIGEFSCSDERLNRLQANIVWSQRGNFLSVPTDCPQRDERLGWTGDAQVFAATAAFNYDVRGFMRKWLRDLMDAQRSDGAIPHVAPDLLTGNQDVPEAQAGAAGWGDAICVVPLRLWHAYGDRRALEEAYPAVVRWLSYLDKNNGGHQPNGGFGDWLAIVPTPNPLVITAYHAYAAGLAAQIADILGRAEDRTRFEAQRDRVRAAFREAYVGGGGVITPGTQTAYTLALCAGLLEPDEVARAADRLVYDIESRGTHLTTGFLGTPWLLDALTDAGRLDVAYRLLCQDTFPSWLYPVVHGGATTITERWDSWSESRGFGDPGMTSFNHYAYGAVGDWIYRTVAGIAPAEPGYRRAIIRPRPGGGLSWARATLHTPYGELAVHWQRDGETMRLDATIPPNTTAEIHISGAVHEAGPGQYTYTA